MVINISADQGTVIRTSSVDKDGNTEIAYITTSAMEDCGVTETISSSQESSLLMASQLADMASQQVTMISGVTDLHIQIVGM